MSTYRVSRRERFTVIDRRAAEDPQLSFKARGILLWLLSKPDDWRCSSDEISDAGKEGRDAVRSGLKELENAGYLVRTKIQDAETGRWSTETVVSEAPNVYQAQCNETPGHPEDGFPVVGNPDVGFPGAIEKTITENPPTPQNETDLVLSRLNSHHVWFQPKNDLEAMKRRAMVTRLLHDGKTGDEIVRRASMLRDKWGTCEMPTNMLIAKWDEFEVPSSRERYGV